MTTSIKSPSEIRALARDNDSNKYPNLIVYSSRKKTPSDYCDMKRVLESLDEVSLPIATEFNLRLILDKIDIEESLRRLGDKR